MDQGPPSLELPACQDTGKPSVATRRVSFRTTSVLETPSAGPDNLARTLQGYGLCYSLMH